jgi:hypothetical protein
MLAKAMQQGLGMFHLQAMVMLAWRQKMTQ